MAKQENATLNRFGRLPTPGVLSDQPSSAERAQRENAVRTAAMAAAKGRPLPPAVLDFILASSDWRQSIPELETRAASVVQHAINDVKAPNWSGASPQQIAAYLASLGKTFGDYRRMTALAEGSDTSSSAESTGTSSSKGAAYTRELAGGDVFKSLVGQGYAREHVMGAIAFAHEMGTSEEMARKFVKIGQDGQEALRKFIDGLDPSLSDEEKRKAAAEFRRGNAKIRKHMTDDDVVQTIRAHDKKQMELRGVHGGVHGESQNDRRLDNQKAGIERKVEAQHGATVANLQGSPDANRHEDDELASIAKRRVAQTDQQDQPKDARGKDAGTTPSEQSKVPQRQAARGSPASPNNG